MKKYILISIIPFFFSCSDDSKKIDVDTTMDVGVDARHDGSTDLGSPQTDMAVMPKGDVGSDLVPNEEDMGTNETSIFESGPHNIGYRSWNFEYDTKGNDTRTLRLSVWYPTSDTEGTSGRYFGLVNRPEIFANATILDGTFPVVVFSHGNSGVGEQSYFFTEFLTSHGFVVVAPDHTGNTFQDDSAGLAEVAAFRPQDVSAVIDEIQNLPTDDPLFGKLTDKIAMSGHSFGGYTTLAASGATFNVEGFVTACESNQPPAGDLCAFFESGGADLFDAGFLDPRIKAAIPLAPVGADFFGMGVSSIRIPTLMITAGQDRTLPNEREGDPLWEQFTAPATRVDILKAGHFSFSNICQIAGANPNVQNDGCGSDFIPVNEAFVIINAYSVAFLKKNLLGETRYDDFLSASGEFANDIILSEK